jgi:sugar/nucleoside kinase (ribokinase family)
MPSTTLVQPEVRPTTFDVVCMGSAMWRLARGTGAASDLRLRPSRGAVNVALQLSERGLRVGLATVLVDDAHGRRAYEAIAARGVDVAGVTFAADRPRLVVMDARGDANPLSSEAEQQPPPEVPATWSWRVLLLSGLSPVVSHVAALCRAARRTRRRGSRVVIDFNAALHVWVGRDPRTIRMLLREVDVARFSIADLAVLGLELEDVRAALRSSATVVVGEPNGRLIAHGAFGEVVLPPRSEVHGAVPTAGAGDALTTAICRELAAPVDRGESPSSVWHRALRGGAGLNTP